MATRNKWHSHSPPTQSSPNALFSSLDYGLPGESPFRPDGSTPNVSALSQSSSVSNPDDPRGRTASLLRDALRDLGIDDLVESDLVQCSDGVLSVMWKLVADNKRNIRRWQDERDRSAKVDNDNKVLKAKAAKLADELHKLRGDIGAIEIEFKRKESVLQKAALTYKGREKTYVAEMRKQELEMDRFQDRVRRSVSVARPVRGPIEERSPPPGPRLSFISPSRDEFWTLRPDPFQR